MTDLDGNNKEDVQKDLKRRREGWWKKEEDEDNKRRGKMTKEAKDDKMRNYFIRCF